MYFNSRMQDAFNLFSLFLPYAAWIVEPHPAQQTAGIGSGRIARAMGNAIEKRHYCYGWAVRGTAQCGPRRWSCRGCRARLSIGFGRQRKRSDWNRGHSVCALAHLHHLIHAHVSELLRRPARPGDRDGLQRVGCP